MKPLLEWEPFCLKSCQYHSLRGCQAKPVPPNIEVLLVLLVRSWEFVKLSSLNETNHIRECEEDNLNQSDVWVVSPALFWRFQMAGAGYCADTFWNSGLAPNMLATNDRGKWIALKLRFLCWDKNHAEIMYFCSVFRERNICVFQTRAKSNQWAGNPFGYLIPTCAKTSLQHAVVKDLLVANA